MLLAALDQTVVGTAMPRIVTALGGTNITWVVTSYLLASTVSIPIIGKLSDIYGRRIFFMGGMVIFLLGSALSGTSQNMEQLVLYRGIQGLGAGALMPIALAVIGDIFEPAERAKWQGLFVARLWALGHRGTAHRRRHHRQLGLALGLLCEHACGSDRTRSPPVSSCRSHVKRIMHKIDYLGTGLLVIWATSLLLGFSLGGTNYAWNSWQIITLFAVAAVGLAAFIFVELHQPEPIINPNLFKTDIFSISTLSMFLLGAGMFGAISYLTYFAQIGLGETATNTGIILTPMMLGFIVSSILGGQLMARTGRYKIHGARRLCGGGLRDVPALTHDHQHDQRRADPQHDRHRSGHRRADEPLHHHRTERVQPGHAGTGHLRYHLLPVRWEPPSASRCWAPL